MLVSLHLTYNVFHPRGQGETKEHSVIPEVTLLVYLLQWDHALPLPPELPEELWVNAQLENIYMVTPNISTVWESFCCIPNYINTSLCIKDW